MKKSEFRLVVVEGPSPVRRAEVLGTPSAIPFNYDCFGEGLPQEGEEVWASTGVVEGPSLVGRTEVLGTPSVIPSNYGRFGEGLPQEGQEERTKISESQCAQRSLNLCALEFISRRSPGNQEKIKKTFASRIFTPSLPDRRKKAATSEGRNATEVR